MPKRPNRSRPPRPKARNSRPSGAPRRSTGRTGTASRSTGNRRAGNTRRGRAGRRFSPISLLVLLLVLIPTVLAASTQSGWYTSGSWGVVENTTDWLELYDNGKTSAVETAVAGETQLHFIDVGQGDATLIAQSGHYALIDAGVSGSAEDLVAYLHSLEIETIDVLVMTHAHADHIGGMDEVIAEFNITTMVMPDFDLLDDYPTSTTFERVIEALAESDAEIVTAAVGDVYAVGEGSLQIISTGVQTDNANNVSVCTLFTAGDFSMLNTGDAELEVEEAILASRQDISATVFQAGHHGSSTSNSLSFMQAVHCDYVVISCGLDNSYGHPHAEVLENYDSIGAAYYRTDLNGNVVITYTAEAGITVLCEDEIEQAA